jgi:phosphoserine phosphatase
MISKNQTPVNEFSPDLWASIESTLRSASRTRTGPLFAAFDADGTLWDADAGETFFDWQIHNCALTAFSGIDPWTHYHNLKNPDPRVGYVWLAQISAGHRLAEVREWAAECFRSVGPWPVFESQRRLIALLRELDIDVYVVTASIKWAVEPVAALFGIDFDHVIGIETEVHGGVITDIVKPPITWRDGKAEGFLAKTGGVRPVLAAGNTFGDIALLDCATHVRLALSTQSSPGGLFDEESKLFDHASSANWHIHPFRRR